MPYIFHAVSPVCLDGLRFFNYLSNFVCAAARLLCGWQFVPHGNAIGQLTIFAGNCEQLSLFAANFWRATLWWRLRISFLGLREMALRGLCRVILAQDLVKIAETWIQDLVRGGFTEFSLHLVLGLRCRGQLIDCQSSSFFSLVHFLELKFCGSQNGERVYGSFLSRMNVLRDISSFSLVATIASILGEGPRKAREWPRCVLILSWSTAVSLLDHHAHLMPLWLGCRPCVDHHALLLWCFRTHRRARARLQLLLPQIFGSRCGKSTSRLRQVIVSGRILILWDALNVARSAEIVEFVGAALFARQNQRHGLIVVDSCIDIRHRHSSQRHRDLHIRVHQVICQGGFIVFASAVLLGEIFICIYTRSFGLILRVCVAVKRHRILTPLLAAWLRRLQIPELLIVKSLF